MITVSGHGEVGVEEGEAVADDDLEVVSSSDLVSMDEDVVVDSKSDSPSGISDLRSAGGGGAAADAADREAVDTDDVDDTRRFIISKKICDLIRKLN